MTIFLVLAALLIVGGLVSIPFLVFKATKRLGQCRIVEYRRPWRKEYNWPNKVRD